ncbi:hypothetical protein ACNS7O_07100 [Haloferacaceae archaeon DSL9]
MILVVAYSRTARTDLRNTCRRHDSCVVRAFGRVALFEETEWAAFHLLRLRTRHETDIQLEWTTPFNEFKLVSAETRRAVEAYETRADKYTPYRTFAAGTEHPTPEALRERSL